jgi:DNA-binding transcriptional MerR regulator
MMGDDTLTHKDLSGMLGVSQTTIKNYRRKFPGLIPLATRGKPLRFKPEAAEICKTIRDGFEHGLSVDEIREKLAPKYAAKPEPGGTGNDAGLVQALENLSAHMQDMAEGHKAVLDRLQAVEAGLQGLPAAMREILEPLAASTAGQGDEQAHTIDQAPEPEAREEANQDRGRTVRIRARDGSYKRYELKHLQGEAEDQAATEPEAGPGEQAAATEEDDETSSGDGPSTSFYRLPMVVRSEKGEFLGVPGRTEGHLSIDDFLALLRRQVQGEGRLPVTWSGGGDDWTISVCLGKPPFGQDHVMDLARMTTPRGNKVAWLKGMKVGGKKMPDSFLATFLKQLRRELSS